MLPIKDLWARYRGAYAGLPRAAWLLAGVQLVNTSGTMVIFFLTLYLSHNLGFSTERAGMVVSGYGVGMLAGALAGGTLSDRLGPFRVQRLGLTASALLLGLLPFLHQYMWILVGIVLWGFLSSARWPANAAAMADICPETLRSKGFALNRMANNLGATIGPVVGGYLAQHDYRLLFWVDGGTCLLAAGAMLWCFPGKHVKKTPSQLESSPGSHTGWSSDKILLGLLLASVGVGMVFSQLFSTFGPYMKLHQHLSEVWIGRLIAVNTILIVALQMPLIHRTGRHSGVRVAALGCLLLGLGFGLMPAGRGVPFLAATVVIWTFGEMLVMPSLTTLTSLRAPAGSTGHYMGLHSLSFSLGISLGPTIGVMLMQKLGGPALWLAVLVTCLMVACLFWRISMAWDGKSLPSG